MKDIRIIEIKKLLHEANVGMGTFGLIELELIDIEKDLRLCRCIKEKED